MKILNKILASLVFIAAISFCGASASASSVSLSWNLSSTSGVISQNVYRAPCTGTITSGVCSADGAFAVISNVSATTVTYIDSMVIAGGKYDYYVTAVCPATGACVGESVPSVHIAATVPGTSPNPPTGLTITNVAVNALPNNQQQVIIAWSDVPNRKVTYELWGDTELKHGSVRPVNGTYQIAWTGRNMGKYYYRLCDTTGFCTSDVIS